MFHATIVGCLLLVGCLAGCSNDPATRYVDRGTLPVGHTVVEPDGATTLQVKAWYPARVDVEDPVLEYAVTLKLPGFPETSVPFVGRAHLDAPPDDGGPFPLVVLSHGFSLNPEWYHPLAEHLASHGFVVLGPEHDEADWFVDVVRATVERPVDVTQTIDRAATGPLASIIDLDRVAVIGHSYGGYTALASAGARLNPSNLVERCAGVTDPFVSAFFCDVFVDSDRELAERLGLDGVPTGAWPDLADPRVDAIVSMAGDAYLFGAEGLAEVTVPTLVIGGTADTGTPWAWGSGLTFDAIRSEERMLVALDGAEHFIMTAACDTMPWTNSLPAEYVTFLCEDPGWDKAAAADVVHQLTTAFLLDSLRVDRAASRSLKPDRYADIDALTVQIAE